MYTEVSEEFKSKIMDLSRTFRVKLDFGSFIVNDNVFSLKVRSGLNLDTELTLGTTTSATCDVELYNDGKNYKNRTFQLYIGLLLDSGEYEYIPYGKYIVQTATKKDQTIKLTCADMMYTIDKLFSSNLTYPTSAKNVLDEIAKKYKINYEIEGTDDVIIGTRPAQKNTAREVVGYIASIMGYNAIFDRQGVLRFKWYEDNGYTTNTDYIESPDISESDFTVNYLQYVITSKITDLYGDEDAKMGITVNNPIALAGYMTSVWDKVSGFSYRPVKLKQLLGNILIDVWDIITVVTEDEKIKTIPMLLDVSFDGGITIQIEATELDTDEDYKSPSELAEEKRTESEENIFLVFNATNSDVVNISTVEKELFNFDFTASDETALPFSNTTVQMEENISGLVTLNLKINNNLYQTYKQQTRDGFNIVSFLSVLSGLNKGTNNLSLHILGDSDTIGVVQPANANMVLTGSGLAKGFEWAGIIAIGEQMGAIEISIPKISVSDFNENYDISLNTPTEINITVNMPNIEVKNPHIYVEKFAESIPHHATVTNIANDLIQIEYSNPVNLRKIGALDNSKFSFVGYIGATPTTIGVYEVGLEKPFKPNLLTFDSWEVENDKLTSYAVEVDESETYTVTFVKPLLSMNEGSLGNYLENQLEFFTEVELESKDYTLEVEYLDSEQNSLGSDTVTNVLTLSLPENTTYVKFVVKGERMSLADLEVVYVKLEKGSISTVFRSSNKVVARTDDLTQFADVIAYSVLDLGLLNPFTNEVVEPIQGSFTKINYEVSE